MENRSGALLYMTAPTIRTRHAFTTRLGGVSQGDYASLNLRFHSDDDPENVKENYRLLGTAVGIDTGHMAFTRQVHGTEVRVCTDADVHRLGTPVPYAADGLVTNVPGLALICFTADCVPVLLCDGKHGVIAAVHCGWRSSVSDILGVAVGKMRDLGAVPADICAAVGPAIGYCCFQVGKEVIDAAEAWMGGLPETLYRTDETTPGKYYLDLQNANALRLRQLGVAQENIAVSSECTMCAPEKYWSHRCTGGRRGVQGALIVL